MESLAINSPKAVSSTSTLPEADMIVQIVHPSSQTVVDVLSMGRMTTLTPEPLVVISYQVPMAQILQWDSLLKPSQDTQRMSMEPAASDVSTGTQKETVC